MTIDLARIKETQHAYAEEILELVAVVEAALTIDAAFKRAGTQGVTMDWGPVLEALQPFTNGAGNE